MARPLQQAYSDFAPLLGSACLLPYSTSSILQRVVQNRGTQCTGERFLALMSIDRPIRRPNEPFTVSRSETSIAMSDQVYAPKRRLEAQESSVVFFFFLMAI